MPTNENANLPAGDQGAVEGSGGPGSGSDGHAREGRAALEAQKGHHLQKPGESTPK